MKPMVRQHRSEYHPNCCKNAELIPGEDLNIVCLNGYILICRDAALNEQELFAVMDSLGITADIFDRLENDPETAVRQLTEELPEIVEGELENNGIYD